MCEELLPEWEMREPQFLDALALSHTHTASEPNLVIYYIRCWYASAVLSCFQPVNVFLMRCLDQTQMVPANRLIANPIVTDRSLLSGATCGSHLFIGGFLWRRDTKDVTL